MHRRAFLRLSMSSLAGLLLAASRRGRAVAAAGRPPARACILLYCSGGPSHVDTWDPKPGSAGGGPFRAIATRVPGLFLSEHLPRVAEAAHHLAIVRNMTSREGNHDRARYLVHTGYAPNPTVDFPSLGAWASAQLASRPTELPASISIGGAAASAGFLGAEHAPFVVAGAHGPPQNTSYPREVDFVRFARRRAALDVTEQSFAGTTGDRRVLARQAILSRAVGMMYSGRLRAFDLDEEPESVRTAYGETEFGRDCLLARRLVEAGVKYVEVVLDGWDTHKDNFNRTKKLLDTLDPALAALLCDLAARDLLDSTLVACWGEFGRTPTINGNDGRDHFPAAWSAVLAGCGVRGGVVHGATDAAGDQIVGKPTRVADLLATCAALLGLEPHLQVLSPSGRPVELTDGGEPIREIMS